MLDTTTEQPPTEQTAVPESTRRASRVQTDLEVAQLSGRVEAIEAQLSDVGADMRALRAATETGFSELRSGILTAGTRLGLALIAVVVVSIVGIVGVVGVAINFKGYGLELGTGNGQQHAEQRQSAVP